MNKPDILSCVDCGPVPVSHALHRFSDWLESAFSWYWRWAESVAEFLKKTIPSPSARVWFALTKALKKIGLISFGYAPDAQHSGRTRVMWDEASARGITVVEIRPLHRRIDFFFAKMPGRALFFEGLPRPYEGKGISWMDDKWTLKQRLEKAGLPTARGGVACTKDEAVRIFDEIGPPVIVKPRTGSRSRHTHIGIRTREEFLRAVASAQQISRQVIVERELSGSVHRATCVAGKLVAVCSREMPQVVGDGAHTVRELASLINADERRQDGVFHLLPTDASADEVLHKQDMEWSNIPAAGQKVFLGAKVNRGLGGVVIEHTPRVHPENRALFERISAVVDDPLVGIDFIIVDVARPWTDQECGVIECNSLPFIELHHHPFEGEPVNVAGAVWDAIMQKVAL